MTDGLHIECDPAGSEVEGRNGCFEITAVHAYTYDASRHRPARVDLNAIGKRGTRIRGGLSLDVTAMDRLAIEWLRSRYSLLEIGALLV